MAPVKQLLRTIMHTGQISGSSPISNSGAITIDADGSVTIGDVTMGGDLTIHSESFVTTGSFTGIGHNLVINSGTNGDITTSTIGVTGDLESYTLNPHGTGSVNLSGDSLRRRYHIISIEYEHRNHHYNIQ